MQRGFSLTRVSYTKKQNCEAGKGNKNPNKKRIVETFTFFVTFTYFEENNFENQ